MPVPLGRNDFNLIRPAEMGYRVTATESYKILSFNPDELGFYKSTTHQLNMNDERLFDVIDVHGSGRFVFATINLAYHRPISNDLFSEFITARHPGWVGGNNRPPVKLSVCYGATGGRNSLGQTLAVALQRITYGGRGTVNWSEGAPANEWVRFRP